MCECLRIKRTYFSRHNDHSASLWFGVCIIKDIKHSQNYYSEQFTFSNFNDSNKQQCWYMVKFSRSPSCFTWFDHVTSEVHTKRSKVAGLNSAVVTSSCALRPLTRLFIYIVYVHQAAIRYQITLVGGYLRWAGVPSREGAGGGLKPLISIFLYIFYNPFCRKGYVVIYSAYICLNRSYILNV